VFPVAANEVMVRLLAEHSTYLPGERVKLLVESAKGGRLVLKRGQETVGSWSVGSGHQVVEAEALEPGLYEAVLEPEGLSAHFAVLEQLETEPLLAVVFHNHQAPNYSPDGAVREPWAYKHVWEDEFQPYCEGGAYYVQAKLLAKWGLAWNANLSPSLLKQWVDLLERGAVVNSDGVYVSVGPESPLAERVAETLETFKRLARGPLEVLTSFYSHPLAGYIAETFGWLDLLAEELELGKRITEQVVGVEPFGVWLPEMSFSMKLVPLLAESGLRYTVLDAVSHFVGATGDKGSIYEPYALGGLTVFFRHTGLSDLWSFKYSNVKTRYEAEAGARDLALRLVLEAYSNRARPLTVALDGENWMILPSPKPATALLLDELLGQLKAAEAKGLVKLVRMSDLAGRVEPRRLASVPPKSWRGGYDKWVSELASVQERIWANVVEAYELYKALETSVGCGEEEKLALMNAVNSDHIWAEFADEGFSREWALALKRKLESTLSSLKLEGFAGGRLRLRNTLRQAVRVLVREDGRVQEVVLHPGTTELEVGGSVVEIFVKGWRKEFAVCKPIVKSSKGQTAR